MNAKGRVFNSLEIEWAFNKLREIPFVEKTKYYDDILKRKGSFELAEDFFKNFRKIVFNSGMVRVHTSYCETMNNPFQGLAADGAKEAMFELITKEYRVVNFIHDEFIIELPLTSDLKSEEEKIKKIMTSAMQKHCPDVKINVESDWMFNWSKEGTHILDQDGKLTPK